MNFLIYNFLKSNLIKREIIIKMEHMASNLKVQKQLISSKNILFIQDIDGVCIPLVKDPMTRDCLLYTSPSPRDG